MEHFGAVVIGSGFGGSVSAYRFAERGLRVCVLERGAAHPPGTFPRAPHRFARAFWDPSAGLYGMFNVWFFRHIAAVVASGLGGGSLVYGNVLLRKDERWFVRDDLASGGYEHWPIGREDLEEHYANVEQILVPQRYPSGDGYANVKISAFREAARRVAARAPGKYTVEELPLGIHFGQSAGAPFSEEHANRYNAARRTCTLCGECSMGCNVGAKNTLDLTYLSRAEKLSATIRTSAEVRAFRPRRGGGFEVDYVVHDLAREGRPFDTSVLAPTTITCDRLVLAAGSLGTSYLLLKNMGAFPAMSRAHVGTRFSGNGDMLAVALLATKRVDDRVEPWAIDSSMGPPITHALRRADAVDTGDPRDGRGFYLEDSGIATPLMWMIEGLSTPGWIARGWRFARRVLWKLVGRDHDTDLGSELADFLGPMALSSRSMPLLGMGRDVPDGRFSLDRDRLQLDWSKRRSSAFFDELTDAARAVAEELGAQFKIDPLSDLFGRTITVHPLGGAPMGRNRHEGVTDSHGRVFGHPGLAIIDGSILPGSVGANPSLTIAAIADRASLALASWAPGGAWPS